MPATPTLLADIIDPEILADQTSAKFPDQLVLGQSNLVEVDSTFPLGSPGTTFTIPFWKRIGGFAAKAETVALVPGKITTGKEKAIVERAGAAYQVSDVAELVSKSDPVGEIASQIARRAAEYIDNKLTLKLEKTPNTYDGTAAVIGPDAIITALVAALGDNHGKLVGGGALIMHSKPYGDLLKTGAIQNNYQSGMDVLRSGVVPTLLGMPIHVSDLVTVTAASSNDPAYYNTYIVGPGQLALFYQRKVLVEFDRDILLQADIIAATVHFATHLFGWDDDTDAQTAEQAKSIHVVKLQTR
jgi:hypothetical protein